MKNKITTFKELFVWQKAHQLLIDTVKDVETFQKSDTTKIIANQILRSVSSISANIAEGFGRASTKEFEHYLIIARGSTTESENWFINSRDLKLISEEVFKQREGTCEEIIKMLNSLIGSLRKKH